MVNFVANAFLTIFQFILRVFKKAVCCLRRRRRLSCEPVPLTNIGVVPNVQKVSYDYFAFIFRPSLRYINTLKFGFFFFFAGRRYADVERLG